MRSGTGTLRSGWHRAPILGSLRMNWLVPLGWAVLLIGLPLFALGFHGDGWAWPDWQDPLWQGLRLPRVLAALLVGAALSAAGAALQALFRNPMADPGLIGTSGGSAFAVVGIMALGWHWLPLPLAAFTGGLLATWLLLALSQRLGGGTLGLLLMGLMLGSLFGALTGIMLFLSDDLTLRSAMTWLAGQLGASTGAPLIWAAPVALTGMGILLALGRDLDCLLLGEEAATSLGVRVHRVRLYTAIGAALTVGAAVSVAGIIGFVGMMIPNACSLIFGGSRRQLITVSALYGALFLLGMDTLARGIAYPINLPVGLLAGFVGPVFFVWLFRQRTREPA